MKADVAVCRLAELEFNPERTIPPGPNYYYFPGVIETGDKGAILAGLHIDEGTLFDQVMTGSDIVLFGYPTSLAGNTSLDKDTPPRRSGIVAGKTNNREIVIDCPVYFGNSGALVAETFRENRPPIRPLGVAVRMIPFVESLYSKELRREVGTQLLELYGFTP
ncbi:MAG: hypothetical protein ACJ8EL_19220 [Rhizomicrobium sp.]